MKKNKVALKNNQYELREPLIKVIAAAEAAAAAKRKHSHKYTSHRQQIFQKLCIKREHNSSSLYTSIGKEVHI